MMSSPLSALVLPLASMSSKTFSLTNSSNFFIIKQLPFYDIYEKRRDFYISPFIISSTNLSLFQCRIRNIFKNTIQECHNLCICWISIYTIYSKPPIAKIGIFYFIICSRFSILFQFRWNIYTEKFIRKTRFKLKFFSIKSYRNINFIFPGTICCRSISNFIITQNFIILNKIII